MRISNRFVVCACIMFGSLDDVLITLVIFLSWWLKSDFLILRQVWRKNDEVSSSDWCEDLFDCRKHLRQLNKIIGAAGLLGCCCWSWRSHFLSIHFKGEWSLNGLCVCVFLLLLLKQRSNWLIVLEVFVYSICFVVLLWSDFVQQLCTYDCTKDFYLRVSWESVLIHVESNDLFQQIKLFLCLIVLLLFLLDWYRFGFKCILYTLNYVFRYPFVSISAVFDYVLSPNKGLELYPFHLTKSIQVGILIKAGKCPSKKKHCPLPVGGWCIFISLAVWRRGPTIFFEHFSLGEDSTPPTLWNKMTLFLVPGA